MTDNTDAMMGMRMMGMMKRMRTMEAEAVNDITARRKELLAYITKNWPDSSEYPCLTCGNSTIMSVRASGEDGSFPVIRVFCERLLFGNHTLALVDRLPVSCSEYTEVLDAKRVKREVIFSSVIAAQG